MPIKQEIEDWFFTYDEFIIRLGQLVEDTVLSANPIKTLIDNGRFYIIYYKPFIYEKNCYYGELEF